MRPRKPPFAGIICPLHNHVDITQEEYERQMDSPDEWRCPKCGIASEFDEERYDQLHPGE